MATRSSSNTALTWRYIIAIGGAFAAWVLQLSIGYILVDYACGGSARWVIRVVSALALAAAAGSVYMAWTLLISGRRARPNGPDSLDLDRFGAAFGLLTSGLFLGLVVLTGVATIVLSPCVH